MVLSVPCALEICPTDHCDSLCVWVYWRQARPLLGGGIEEGRAAPPVHGAQPRGISCWHSRSGHKEIIILSNIAQNVFRMPIVSPYVNAASA